MAFYDYKCKKCGLVFEIKKGMNDGFSPPCPKCGSVSDRIFSAPRTLRSDRDIMNSAGSEQSGSCSTCSSGVCSSCGGK